jgi:hypothetical protein
MYIIFSTSYLDLHLNVNRYFYFYWHSLDLATEINTTPLLIL